MSGELCDPGLRGFEGWGYPGAGGGAEKSVGERMKGFRVEIFCALCEKILQWKERLIK